AQVCASADEAVGALVCESFAQRGGCGQHHCLQLVERAAAGAACAAPLDEQQPQLLTLAAAAAELGEALTVEQTACRTRRIDQIALPSSSFLPPGSFNLEHGVAGREQRLRQSGAIAGRTFERECRLAKR